ncbi:MAG: (Fe-S)-binding protein [Promethearchaeota archaeon]|nr:MAG: (Fe-S)-binding protein [Candidatus Lokiarchaeota archaeon]
MSSYINNKIKNDNTKIKILEESNKKIITASNYCYACNRCVNVCPLSHLDLFFPRILVGDLVFSSTEEIVNNHNIWNCLTCGQCTIYCPMNQENNGINIPKLILELRKNFKNDETQIERISQCETHNEIFPTIWNMIANNSITPDKLEFLKEKGLKTTDFGEIAYFIGCLPLMEEIFYNLDLKYTNSPSSIINLLNEADIIPVVLNEKCCGHDILWGKGDIETFKKFAEYNTHLYRKAGVKTVIVGCAEGYRTWKFDYPKIIENFDFRVMYFTEFFLEKKILENIRFPYISEIKVTFHDSCRIGRLADKLYDSPRELISKIPGVKLIEMENIKDDANCCGVSAFSNCNESTRFLRQNRITEAVNTGADYLIVPCPKCLTHFNCYLNELSLNKEDNELRSKIKVVDLASFIGKLLMFV